MRSEPESEAASARPGEYPYNRAMPAMSEEMARELLPLAFARIAEARDKLNGPYVLVVDERSSLRLDDRYLGQWRQGGLHLSALLASVDSLTTVRVVLESVFAGTASMPMAGLFPLLRTGIECAALGIYLLDPAARDERLRRAYRVARDDAKNRAASAATRGATDTTLVEHAENQIRALIGTRPSLGDPEAFTFPRVEYSALVKNADAVIAADPAIDTIHQFSLLGWWQWLSGVSHGKFWAFLDGHERHDAIVDEANESAYVRQTASLASVAVALMRSIEALEAALRLYGQRSKAAWAQPEDATEPPVQTWRELHQQ